LNVISGRSSGKGYIPHTQLITVTQGIRKMTNGYWKFIKEG